MNFYTEVSVISWHIYTLGYFQLAETVNGCTLTFLLGSLCVKHKTFQMFVDLVMWSRNMTANVPMCELKSIVISNWHNLFESHSVVFVSLKLHGLYSPWNSPHHSLYTFSLPLLSSASVLLPWDSTLQWRVTTSAFALGSAFQGIQAKTGGGEKDKGVRPWVLHCLHQNNASSICSVH